MKKIFVFLLVSLFLLSCKQKVELIIYNNTDIDRQNEIVEFCFCSVKDKIAFKRNDRIIILDADNKQVPYQVLADNRTIIFPATVLANDSSIYTVLVGKPDTIHAKTYGRQIPERKDDFTWENDRIAFRMYGPALAPENPSNGVDVWLKRTENLVIDKFYKNDLAEIQSYHIDNGEGLDCYKVGHTLGAGGIAPYIDTTLYIGTQYDHFSVSDSGPLRTTFKLTYDSLKIGDNTIKQIIYISLDAGCQLNKATVIYEDNSETFRQLASGIYLHDSIGATIANPEKGFIAYAEDAVSDAGVPSGRSYVGVIIPSYIDSVITKDDHLLAISRYFHKKSFTYYFGAGWSKWGFPTDKDWFDYMEHSAIRIKKPLILIVK